jgi:hypothetical protein
LYLGSKILEHSSYIDRCTRTNTISVSAFLQVPTETPDWKLEISLDRFGNGLVLQATSIATSSSFTMREAPSILPGTVVELQSQ